MENFDVVYYIADNKLWMSISGQAHLPVDPNELVAGYEKRIAELEAEVSKLKNDVAHEKEMKLIWMNNG